MILAARGPVALTLALALAAIVSCTAAAAQGTGVASLAGATHNASGQSVGNVTVQLRDLVTGQLAGTTTSSSTGSFTFGGLAAGNYSVEIVNAAGRVIGSSAAIPVAAGATVSGVTVSTSAAAVVAGGSVVVAGVAVSGASSAVIVTTVAVGAGIAAVVSVVPAVSPSQ